MICVSCHKGVPIDSLRSHVRVHHKGRRAPSALEQIQLKDALSKDDIRSSQSDRYTQPAGQKPVDGLEVLPGYLCPLATAAGIPCSQAFHAPSSFGRHLSSHPVHPKPSETSCSSTIQTLFNRGGLQSYFSVDTSLSHPDPPKSSVYVDALKLLRTIPPAKIPVPDNDKDRASVHWFTRWPELMQPYCRDEAQVDALRSLVSFPKVGTDPDWLTRVQTHGSRWWIKAEFAHARCSYRASVLLKSHQEYALYLLSRSRSVNILLCRYSGAWKVLREQESSRRYCGFGIAFVSFCLRAVALPDNVIPVRFSDKTKTVLMEYRSYLMSNPPPSDHDVDRFQLVISSVLFRERQDEIDLAGKLACPVQSFMAILALRGVGQFVKAALVTQPISKLLYLSRCSVLLLTLYQAPASDKRFIR